MNVTPIPGEYSTLFILQKELNALPIDSPAFNEKLAEVKIADQVAKAMRPTSNEQRGPGGIF